VAPGLELFLEQAVQRFEIQTGAPREQGHGRPRPRDVPRAGRPPVRNGETAPAAVLQKAAVEALEAPK
jgi:hypothetical protein